MGDGNRISLQDPVKEFYFLCFYSSGLRTMVNAFLRSMRMLTDVLVLSLFFISIFALIGMQLFVGDLRNKCVLIPGTNVTDFQKFVANESKFSNEKKNN